MTVKIFFCYAHEDELFLKKLKAHLKPLQQQGIIDVWHDRDIGAGTDWGQEINEHLHAAHIILLLVSPDFMASEYCYSIEMQQAMERHKNGEAIAIPVILRPCLWQETPFSKLQALPRDAEPVANWSSMDQAFLDVTKGILNTIDELRVEGIRETSEGLNQDSSSFNRPTSPDLYKKRWSRQLRGLLVLLLDHSGSMQEEVNVGDRTYTNGQLATTALNNLILSVINNTPVDSFAGDLKDYFDVLVLGYGDWVTPVLHNGHGGPISIRELAKHPVGYHRVMVTRYTSQGLIQQVQENQPYWVTYAAYSRYTEMALALQHARQAIQKWLGDDKWHCQSFPPIVINITDGRHNGTGNPVTEASRIRELATHDGHVLLFNCHLTGYGGQRVVFPESEKTIITQIADSDEREWASQLFDMSSVIPKIMLVRARNLQNILLEDGVHGFLYNANPGDLINFLKWGTQPN